VFTSARIVDRKLAFVEPTPDATRAPTGLRVDRRNGRFSAGTCHFSVSATYRQLRFVTATPFIAGDDSWFSLSPQSFCLGRDFSQYRAYTLTPGPYTIVDNLHIWPTLRSCSRNPRSFDSEGDISRRSAIGRLASLSSKSHVRFCRFNRARYTPRSIASSNRPGSSPNGGRPRPVAWLNSTRSHSPAADNSKGSWRTGIACRQRSTWSSRRHDMRALAKVRLRLRSLFARRIIERAFDDETWFSSRSTRRRGDCRRSAAQ
jgi:hypothetical protein